MYYQSVGQRQRDSKFVQTLLPIPLVGWCLDPVQKHLGVVFTWFLICMSKCFAGDKVSIHCFVYLFESQRFCRNTVHLDIEELGDEEQNKARE